MRSASGGSAGPSPSGLSTYITADAHRDWSELTADSDPEYGLHEDVSRSPAAGRGTVGRASVIAARSLICRRELALAAGRFSLRPAQPQEACREASSALGLTSLP